ncbi:hypothetical protein [Paenibacillus sp. 1A_MP2]|uniref:hypothetical protein n=1 Tax=Paenibacillus sp. 1A_MP2 TaxID=3457495 RepID=UPI003FCDA356
MGSKILPDWIHFIQSSNSAREHISWNGAGSYIDAMYRILMHKQWTDLPRHMIAGMTTSVFRLVVDRGLTTESISAYNWMAENFVAADFIGVTTGQHGGFSFELTFPLYQKQALLDIKASIDRGSGPFYGMISLSFARGMMMGSRYCLSVKVKEMKLFVCPMILLVGTVHHTGTIRCLNLIQP